MKNWRNLKFAIAFVVLAIGFWTLGFIQGNASGTQRMASVELLRSFNILKKLDQSDIRGAAAQASLVVASTSSWLDSEHFWLVALEHEFVENPEEEVQTISTEAGELVRRERASVNANAESGVE